MREMKASRLTSTSGATIKYSVSRHQLQLQNYLPSIIPAGKPYMSVVLLKQTGVMQGEQKDKETPYLPS